jgi:hypothetical protein
MVLAPTIAKKESAMSDPKGSGKADDPEMQGEGNYTAARRYDEATTEFVKAGKVDEAASKARPKTEAEADEMKKAEQAGKSHAKGEDPALHKKQKSQG